MVAGGAPAGGACRTVNGRRVAGSPPPHSPPHPHPLICLTDGVDYDAAHPKEACGVFGVYAPGQPVAQLTYLGLFALQHRGARRPRAWR